MQGWLAVLSTLTGAIIGALLRPLLDNYFELRRKTLRVDLSAGRSESILPDKHMKVVWGTRTFTRLVRLPFTIENPSGRTLKDFLLKIELIDQSGLPAGEDLLFEVLMSAAHSASFKNVTTAKAMRPANGFEFDYVLPKGKVHGFAVANCDGELQFTSPHDLEIATVRVQRYRLGAEQVQRLLAGFSLMLAIATLAALSPDLPIYVVRWFEQLLGVHS